MKHSRVDIKDPLVNFENAQLLKRIGFDVPTYNFFKIKSDDLSIVEDSIYNRCMFNYLNDHISRPTIAVAKEWLKQVYNKEFIIDKNDNVYVGNLVTDDGYVVKSAGKDENLVSNFMISIIIKKMIESKEFDFKPLLTIESNFSYTGYHIPTKETWLIIGINVMNNKVCAAGYPKTMADLSDVIILNKSDLLTQDEIKYRKTFNSNWH